MFEQLNKQVTDLREKLQSWETLSKEEQQLLEKLSNDLHAYVTGQTHQTEHEQLTERVNQASIEFDEKHPDLAVILKSTMQILQNMGV